MLWFADVIPTLDVFPILMPNSDRIVTLSARFLCVIRLLYDVQYIFSTTVQPGIRIDCRSDGHDVVTHSGTFKELNLQPKHKTHTISALPVHSLILNPLQTKTAHLYTIFWTALD